MRASLTWMTLHTYASRALLSRLLLVFARASDGRLLVALTSNTVSRSLVLLGGRLSTPACIIANSSAVETFHLSLASSVISLQTASRVLVRRGLAASGVVSQSGRSSRFWLTGDLVYFWNCWLSMLKCSKVNLLCC